MGDTFLQDLRYSFRVLRSNPLFSIVAVVALAIGIGANTAIFSLVNAIVLKPLQFRDPDRLVWIWSTRTDRDKAVFSIPDFIDYREQGQGLEEIAAFAQWNTNLTESGDPEQLSGVRLTPNAFRMLGVEAIAGRTILPDDGTAGKDSVVVLKHGLWQRRFGGDRNVIGKSITLNGAGHTVIGVLPPHFNFPGVDAEIAKPLVFETDPRREDRNANFLRSFGRLKPGVTIAQAQAELEPITEELVRLYPGSNSKKTNPRLLPLQGEIVGGHGTVLLMLQGAVVLVLLIACSNLANLLLARASARHKEIAIRTATGATRGRLIKQLLTESGMLAAMGGFLGLILAWRGVGFLLALGPADLPRSSEVAIDESVLSFTLGVSLVAGVIFGLVPAVQASRVDVIEELKGTGRGLIAPKRNRARNLLVVWEIGLSLVVLISAGLLVKSFVRIQNVGAGFDTENTVVARMSLPPSKYATRQAITVFYDNLLSRLVTLPGVQGVGAANALPLSGRNVRNDFTIVGRPARSAAETPGAQTRWVSHGYFQAIGIPVVKGREFTPIDNDQSAAVAVIDDALAKRFWPNENPLGAHIVVQNSAQLYEMEIVGVVGNVKHVSLDEDTLATLYMPLDQVFEATVSFVADDFGVAVRTGTNPTSMETALRREVGLVDKDVPSSNIRTMEQVLSASVAPRRFNLLMLLVFAAAALLLAATGIYGVVSFMVTQRTHEIGVRMALGADRRDVMKLLMRHGVRLALGGVVLGVVLTLALVAVIKAFGFGLAPNVLFGVSALDPITYVITSTGLVVVTMCACYIPGRRAIKVDPVIALRAE